MRLRSWFELGLVNILAVAALAASPMPAAAQVQAADTFKCNMLHAEQGKAGSTELTSSDPEKLTPVNDGTKNLILKSGLPCDAINIPDGPVEGTPAVADKKAGGEIEWEKLIDLSR